MGQVLISLVLDRGEDFVYGIFDKDETEVIGGNGMHPRVGPQAQEIGDWMAAKHAGKGYT